MADIEILNLFNKAEIPIKCRPYYPSLSDYQQIELLKVLIDGRWVEFAHYKKDDYRAKTYNCFYAGTVNFRARVEALSFDEVIAGILNRMWENLSTTDKERIRKILGG